jgi:uncharacterized integral membrane protein
MQFLKTLFWVVVAVVAALFAYHNWAPVSLSLWAGLIVEVKLPALLLFAFLLGLVPMYLVHRGRVWGLRRRLGQPGRVTVANQPLAAVPAPAQPAERVAEEGYVI